MVEDEVGVVMGNSCRALLQTDTVVASIFMSCIDPLSLSVGRTCHLLLTTETAKIIRCHSQDYSVIIYLC